jgi:pre-mRNA-splicing factor SYF1
MTRRTLDRALRALPFTQHERIWSLYLKLATALETLRPRGAAEIWSRYWRVAADRGEAKVAARHLGCLLRCGFYDDAASLLTELAQNEPPTLGKDEADQLMVEEEAQESCLIMPGQYWQELCRIVTQHGAAVTITPVETVLRGAIKEAMARSHFGALQQRRARNGPIHATGIFWTALATWHIRHGRIEQARQVYEEAVATVPTVRDFALVFDAYAKMEESVIAVALERQSRKKPKQTGATVQADAELDARMAHFEALMDRRPFLLSEVCVRQQPNKVAAWIERAQLFKDSGRPVEKVTQVYEEALVSIHPRRAKGPLSSVWISYAQYVLESGQDWRAVFRRAVESDYGNVDELAAVWIAFADMEMQVSPGHGLAAAVELLGEALAPQRTSKDLANTPQGVLYKNIKLWEHFLDLEEARGLLDATRCAYERVIELGIATPQTFVNFALFLERLDPPATEEAFRVYERGTVAFGYPAAFELWNIYLPKYVAYYAPRGQLERIRDLFEQALRGCPARLCQSIFIEYASVEEQFGSGRNALRILERAAGTVAEEHKPGLFDLWLAKTQVLLGVTAQRAVFEAAIAALPSPAAAEMSLRYASLETSLGETERARAIYAHAASAADPRLSPELWAAWQEFETRHGTEVTFRDMLRVKRAVASKFVATMPFVPEQASAATVSANDGPSDAAAGEANQ